MEVKPRPRNICSPQSTGEHNYSLQNYSKASELQHATKYLSLFEREITTPLIVSFTTKNQYIMSSYQ